MSAESCSEVADASIDEAWLNDFILQSWDSLTETEDSQQAEHNQQTENDEQACLLLVPAPFTAAASIKYTPIYLPNVLLEHWFSDVCPMWSAFDSSNNRYRQLASEDRKVAEQHREMAAAYGKTHPDLKGGMKNPANEKMQKLDGYYQTRSHSLVHFFSACAVIEYLAKEFRRACQRCCSR